MTRIALWTIALALLASTVPLAPAGGQSGRTFTWPGRGWGHGLGMSQWGARGLAEKGWSTDRILTHYYRGTRVETKTTPPNIRVGLFHGQPNTNFRGQGSVSLYDHTGAKRATAGAGESWGIKPISSTELAVYNARGARAFTSSSPMTIRYGTGVELSRTGHTYRRGRIEFGVDRGNRTLRAVLFIPFEHYLYGVAEMPSSWHAEALKAQAIAARTYAVEKVTRLGQHRSGCDCAVVSTTSDQVYAGDSHEVTRWVQAVDNTRGRVVTYNGAAIQALYSASSGGYTENSETSGGTALPYLRGVCDPGDYASGANPHSNWTVTIDGDDLDARMKDRGFDIGEVRTVKSAGRGVSGRIGKVIDPDRGGLTITGSEGVARMSGETFRSMLGARSTLVHYRITGGIRLRWDRLNCSPGLPRRDEYTWRNLDGRTRGRAQDFGNGRLFLNSSSGAVFWVRTAILARYDAERRNGNDLGLPTTDEYAKSEGRRRSGFERGYITLYPNGKTTVTMTG